jgi:hypothetical protein
MDGRDRHGREATVTSRWRTSDASELVTDCEAMLAGRSAERLMRTARPVAPWAWLNLVAHGTARDLRRPRMIATTEAERPWARARAYLAGEVMSAVDTGATTQAELQRDVLVPLELSLLRVPGQASTPAATTHVVLAALDAHRRLHRR